MLARFKLHPWIAKPTVVPSLTILNANRAGNKIAPVFVHRGNPSTIKRTPTPSPLPARPHSIAATHSSIIVTHVPPCPALQSIKRGLPQNPPTVPQEAIRTAESFPLGTYSLLGTVVTKVSVAWSSRDKYTREELTFSLRFRQAFG